MGCDMARQCPLNSCPTGIATQKRELRTSSAIHVKFGGRPEQVVAYFTWIAEDVRRILAGLGCRSMDDAIGRVDLLERVEDRKSTRLNSSHGYISYAVFCLKKKKKIMLVHTGSTVVMLLQAELQTPCRP